MPPRSSLGLLRSSAKSLALTITIPLLFLLAVLAYFVFQLALPIRRAYYLETAYQRALEWNPGTAPLIEDVPQLYFWSYWGQAHEDTIKLAMQRAEHSLSSRRTFDRLNRYKTIALYDELLGLWFDGTAREHQISMIYGVEHRGMEYWIYLAGTHPDETDNAPHAFSHKFKKKGCTEDPAYICEMYRNAFNAIVSRWHYPFQFSSGPLTSSQPLLRFVDCDVSPLICGSWGFAAQNMLVHMKVADECETSLGAARCGVTWRHVGLPLGKMPWSRTVRITLDGGGSTVVPAFPDAEEQMWNMIAQDGAWRVAVKEDKKERMVNDVHPVPEDAWKPRSSQRFAEFNVWGGMNKIIEFSVEEEFLDMLGGGRLVLCKMERWLDLFLRWWDGTGDAVCPRTCEASMCRRECVMGLSRDDQIIIEKNPDSTKSIVDDILFGCIDGFVRRKGLALD
jgi:hypothetical protein